MNNEADKIANYFAKGEEMFMNFRDRHGFTCEEAADLIENKKRVLQGLDPLD